MKYLVDVCLYHSFYIDAGSEQEARDKGEEYALEHVEEISKNIVPNDLEITGVFWEKE